LRIVYENIFSNAPKTLYFARDFLMAGIAVIMSFKSLNYQKFFYRYCLKTAKFTSKKNQNKNREALGPHHSKHVIFISIINTRPLDSYASRNGFFHREYLKQHDRHRQACQIKAHQPRVF